MPPPAIPLTHAPDGTGYRLIELPPELQAVLEGGSPPVLSLVSSPTNTAALLKTPDNTYSLRQKNTSNTLMLLTPTATSDQRDGSGECGLDMIGSVQETVELVPETREPPRLVSKMKNTGSQGKWHEKFGRNR